MCTPRVLALCARRAASVCHCAVLLLRFCISCGVLSAVSVTNELQWYELFVSILLVWSKCEQHLRSTQRVSVHFQCSAQRGWYKSLELKTNMKYDLDRLNCIFSILLFSLQFSAYFTRSLSCVLQIVKTKEEDWSVLLFELLQIIFVIAWPWSVCFHDRAKICTWYTWSTSGIYGIYVIYGNYVIIMCVT